MYRGDSVVYADMIIIVVGFKVKFLSLFKISSFLAFFWISSTYKFRPIFTRYNVGNRLKLYWDTPLRIIFIYPSKK